MEEIYFKDEASEKLLAGINKLHDAVASTFGPNGRTVIIANEYGEPYVTKDGVSVARAINFKDPVENIGASLIKEVAELTVNSAGDGTTTSIILATSFINNLQSFNSNDVIKAFDEIIPKVLTELKKGSRVVKAADVKHVAVISANNDIKIGETIANAYSHSTIVKVEEGSVSDDKLELVKGMTLPVSYFSKHYINTPDKAQCNFTNPFILLLEGKLETLVPFDNILNEVSRLNKELVIVTEHVSEGILRILDNNVLNHGLKLCIIKSPGFSTHRLELLKDLSYFTGATLINDVSKKYSMHHLGSLESIQVSKSSSLLVKTPSIDLTSIIRDLTTLSISDELTDHDKKQVTSRIENLTGAVSIIKVGGGSELEMKERFDRYDDAVRAVQCALEEGIVMGGGLALYNAIQTVAKDIEGLTHNSVELSILSSLNAPLDAIMTNGSCITATSDMFKKNIIDPLKVTRCALENAVSVAKTILTTKTVVLNSRFWN